MLKYEHRDHSYHYPSYPAVWRRRRLLVFATQIRSEKHLVYRISNAGVHSSGQTCLIAYPYRRTISTIFSRLSTPRLGHLVKSPPFSHGNGQLGNPDSTTITGTMQKHPGRIEKGIGASDRTERS